MPFDRGDDQNLGALGHHVLDLGELVRNIVFGILQVGLVAQRRGISFTMLSPSEIQRVEDLSAWRCRSGPCLPPWRGGDAGRQDGGQACGAGRPVKVLRFIM